MGIIIKNNGKIHSLWQQPKANVSLERLSCRHQLKDGRGLRISAQPDCLFQMQSEHDLVQVIQLPDTQYLPAEQAEFGGCRLLLVGNKGALYSIYKEDDVLISPNFYWQHLAVVAAAASHGPIGILGLGTGTVARVIHQYWPNCQMHGWELDGIILDAGRQFMGLHEVESTGRLVSHVGDALSDSATVEGGFTGLIVDIFAQGALPDFFAEARTWETVRRKLRDQGVFIGNFGSSLDTVKSLRAILHDEQLFTKDVATNLLVANFNAAEFKSSLPPDLQHTADGWHPLERILI